MSEKKQRFNLNTQIKVALLAVIAFIIMFIEVAIPIFPGFLKLDVSDLPAVVAGFALGPIAGVVVELIKNLLHLLKTTTSGVGELANFIVGSAFVFPAAAVYWTEKTKSRAILGLFIGTICMGLAGAVMNYLVILPFYAKVMPLDEIIKFSAMANKAIVDIPSLILYGIIPFNLFKGIFLSVVTLLIYKRIVPLLRKG